MGLHPGWNKGVISTLSFNFVTFPCSLRDYSSSPGIMGCGVGASESWDGDAEDFVPTTILLW